MVRAYDLNVGDKFSWGNSEYIVIEILDEAYLEVCEIRNGKKMDTETFNGYAEVMKIS